MPKLTIQNKSLAGQTFEWTTGTIHIGRKDSNQFKILDTSVSGVHCTIEPCDGGWCVKDHGSTNGTFLNNHRVTTEAVLHCNDVLSFGEVSVGISGDDVPATEPTISSGEFEALPRTTIVMRPTTDTGSKQKTDGFSNKGKNKKCIDLIITVAIVAIVIAAIALVLKLT